MDQIETPVAPGERELYAWWRGVRVTETTVTVVDGAYAVREMRGLRERSGALLPARRVVVSLAVAQAAIAAMALAKLVRIDGLTPVVFAVGTAAVLVGIVLVAVGRLRWPRPTELWVSYRGEPTMLYRSTDRYEYGKVLRAVQRAMLAQRLLK
jgi:hypothetical protein